MIRVGIIGYGFSAQTFHLPFIHCNAQLELTAICTSRPEIAHQNYPQTSIFTSAEAMLDAGILDLVILTSPNQHHYRQAKLCLEYGVHVVLEKPMVTNSSEAAALIELTQTRPGLLSVFHNRRWDGDFLTLQRLLAREAVGDLRYFESHFDRFRPQVRGRWREQPGAGTGIWWDLGPHLIDQALVLFGMPEAVTGRCLALRAGAQADDFFHVMLHYPQLEVVLHGSPFCGAPNLRFQLQGTRGSYAKYGLDPQEAQLKAGMLPSDNTFGAEPESDYGLLYSEAGVETVASQPGCYQEYYAQLVQAIDTGGEPPVTVEEGSQVIRVLEIAQRSQRQGKTLALEV